MDRDKQVEALKTLTRHYENAPASLKPTLGFYLRKMFADFRRASAPKLTVVKGDDDEPIGIR